jgi:hypothetical protein
VYFSLYEASRMSYSKGVFRKSGLWLQTRGNTGGMCGRIRGTVAWLVGGGGQCGRPGELAGEVTGAAK